MANINVMTTLAHHAVNEDDPTRTACGQPLGDGAVREANSEMVNCLGCLWLLPDRTEAQLSAIGMLEVQKLLRRQKYGRL